VYERIYPRIHGIAFLGTPHQEDNLADLLETVIGMSSNNSRAYVSDLQARSSHSKTINDSFAQAVDIPALWSFYETQKINFGPWNKLIVEKSSAIMDSPREKSMALNASHDNLCKYENPFDENYLRVRNALSEIIEGIPIPTLKWAINS
jgi:hypothetical protein